MDPLGKLSWLGAFLSIGADWPLNPKPQTLNPKP